ncbi:MAG: hypothetical protein ABR611_05660 [Chthoniobacterales bacterium]
MRRGSYALGGIGILVLGISIWNAIERNLDFPWTSIRLAPAFALAHGIPLYSMPDHPPWVMVGYGPLYPVAYLPSVFAHHPRSAVAIATILAHVYVLAPAGLIFSLLRKRETDGDVRPLPWVLFFVLFALVTHLAPSLAYVTAGVHADAPAIGFFLLACYAMLRAELAALDYQTRWLLGAGIAAGLSAACKINFAAVTIGLVIWTWRFFGWKRAALFFSASFFAMLAIYAMAAGRDGLSPVWLNLTQPGKMPWFTMSEIEPLSLSGSSSHEFSEKLRTFLTFSRDYLKVYGAIAVATILVTLVVRETSKTDRTARLVIFFVFLSVCLSPVSIASISKYGGDVNNRALVSLPLSLAAILALASLGQRSSRAGLGAMVAALAAAIFIVALPLKERMQKVSAGGSPILVEAYNVIRADPGRWYYPYDPLAHFLVERKFRPNMDVIYSYAEAGFPVDKDAFHAALPKNLRYLAIPPSVGAWGVTEIRRLLSDYGKPAPELSSTRHRVYSR